MQTTTYIIQSIYVEPRQTPTQKLFLSCSHEREQFYIIHKRCKKMCLVRRYRYRQVDSKWKAKQLGRPDVVGSLYIRHGKM